MVLSVGCVLWHISAKTVLTVWVWCDCDRDRDRDVFLLLISHEMPWFLRLYTSYTLLPSPQLILIYPFPNHLSYPLSNPMVTPYRTGVPAYQRAPVDHGACASHIRTAEHHTHCTTCVYRDVIISSIRWESRVLCSYYFNNCGAFHFDTVSWSISDSHCLYPIIWHLAAVLDNLRTMLHNDDLLDRVSLLASHPYSDIAGQAAQLECLLEQFAKIEDALLWPQRVTIFHLSSVCHFVYHVHM